MANSKFLLVFIVLTTLLNAACSITRMAQNSFADALSQSGDTYGSDNDVELVGQAVPFGLKTMEGLLEHLPEHRGLLLSVTSGFTQYAYVYIEQPADELEATNVKASYELRGRALQMYIRARDYGLRGLAVNHPNLMKSILTTPDVALASTEIDDVPLLYWTAAAWASAISLGKNDPELIADLPVIHALIYRAYQLDDAYSQGAIHTFLISYEMSQKGLTEESVNVAKQHFQRALELSTTPQAGPYVTFAEAVCIPAQDRHEFVRLLNKALSVDSESKNGYRLANLVMQRRARWLLNQIDYYFLDKGDNNEHSD